MLLLLGVAFVAGVVTAISPCVLPVLPIILAGGASGGPRRPFAIVAGLVASFTVFTLTAVALLSALGLPDDLLRNVAIAVVLGVGLALVWPRLGDLLGRPFHALARRRPGDGGGGFLLGVSLGVLFTPCAGPVIGAVVTVAATQSLTVDAFLITLAYGLGAGIVLLGVAVAARRGMSLRGVRAHAPVVRRVLGAAVLAAAVLMILGVDKDLQTRVPEYTRALQALEESATAQVELEGLVGTPGLVQEERLDDYGPAPEFAALESWLNSGPLTMAGLRGKVIVIDFWTYSCINCLRTLPYVKAWYDAYEDDGLVIVGVHTPEFSFERVPDNVRRAVRDHGIEYPVALDNEFGTWEAWSNRYWPAKYFVDRRGRIRYAHFGEGAYEESERVIQQLLDEPGVELVSEGIDDETPSGEQTPETYLGYQRIDRFVGSQIAPDRETEYSIPDFVPLHGLAYGGRWTVEDERIVAGEDARLRLRFHANNVFLVLGVAGGRQGNVDVTLDGKRLGSFPVTQDDIHTLARIPGEKRDHALDLRFAPGTEAYAFTFG